MNKRERVCIYPKTIKFDKDSIDIINSVPGKTFGSKLRYLIHDYSFMKKNLSIEERQRINFKKLL